MKVRYYLWSVLLVLACYACYEDKGNYDYEEINSFEVERITTNQMSPYTVGDTVFAVPTLKFAVDSNENDLTYEWRLMGGRLIGTERELAYVADTVNDNYMPVFASLTVTNGKNGLRANALCTFMVFKKNFQEGWMLLSERNGKAELNYLIWKTERQGDEEVHSFDEYPRVFQQENGVELGGKPLKLQEFWALGNTSHMLLLQDGGLGPICINSADYKKTISVNEEFVDGRFPDGFRPVDAVYGITNDVLLNENGDLYLKKRNNPAAYYTGRFPDYPIYFEKGLKISKLVSMASLWNVEFKLMFDDKNKRYLALTNNNEIINLYHDPVPGCSNLYDMGDVEIIFCEAFQEQRGNTASFFSIYRNNDDGKYYMQKFNVQISGSVQTVTLLYDKEFPGQDLINGNSEFRITRDQRQYLFFSGGAGNNCLYCYIFDAGGAMVYPLYDYEGRRIVKIFTTNEQRAKLGVALSDGKFCLMDASFESIGTGSRLLCETGKEYGKIVDVIYKFIQYGSN